MIDVNVRAFASGVARAALPNACHSSHSSTAKLCSEKSSPRASASRPGSVVVEFESQQHPASTRIPRHDLGPRFRLPDLSSSLRGCCAVQPFKAMKPAMLSYSTLHSPTSSQIDSSCPQLTAAKTQTAYTPQKTKQSISPKARRQSSWL